MRPLRLLTSTSATVFALVTLLSSGASSFHVGSAALLHGSSPRCSSAVGVISTRNAFDVRSDEEGGARLRGRTTQSRLWATAAPPTPPSTPTPPPPVEASANNKPPEASAAMSSAWSFPRRAVELYAGYAGRLWNETNPEARRQQGGDRALRLIRQLRQVLKDQDGTAAGDDADRSDGGGGEISSDGDGGACTASDRSAAVEPSAKRVGTGRKRVLEACDDYVRLIQEESQASRAVPSAFPRPLIVPNGESLLRVVEVRDTMNATGNMLADEFQRSSDDAKSRGLVEASAASSAPAKGAAKKPRRSILFGAMMGMAVAGWVFSGNYIFTTLFTLMTVLGQLEYYRMVQSTGVYPARRISIVGACSMYLTALFTPNLHQICLPMFGLWSMVWFLTVKRSVTTIPEIATTFTGMFYLGYVPSFWVRIRLLDSVVREPTQLAPIMAPILDWVATVSGTRLPLKVTQAVHLPITTGAVFIFWTWLCLAFSDVGAYFVGRRYGKTKLGAVAPAAGATSPNKSVEGVIGGCATSAALAILGAWVQKWPCFWLSGAVHGVALGFLGLVGDLTASMLKRDAGLKDFGDLIPEHGGIMDRVDSFVWAAPYSWLVCSYVIPALKAWCR